MSWNLLKKFVTSSTGNTVIKRTRSRKILGVVNTVDFWSLWVLSFLIFGKSEPKISNYLLLATNNKQNNEPEKSELLIQLNDVDNFDQVKKLQQDKIRESTKELNNASIMRKNDLKRQLENAQAKARVDVEKARIRREKAKRVEFRAREFFDFIYFTQQT